MATVADFIRHDQPILTGAYAVYPYSPAMERKYKFFSRFGDEVMLHRRVGDQLWLPRALCPIGAVDDRVEGQKVIFPGCPTPKPNQVEMFDDTLEFLKAGESGIGVAYTGFGKTVLGCYVTSKLSVKTLVVTTKDDIYQQWLDRACGRVSKANPEGLNFLGLKESEVGEIRADKYEVHGAKFCVAMIHSLSRDGKYPESLGKEFGLVIFDEIHRLAAEHFSKVAWLFRAKLRLGLSAEPRRRDGKDVLIFSHIGPIRTKVEGELMVPKVLLYTTEWKCPRHPVLDPQTGERKIELIPHEAGHMGHIENILAANKPRNLIIAKAAKMAFDKSRTIIVFSTRIEHLKNLEMLLVGLGVPAKDCGVYMSGATKAEKAAQDRALGCKVIFSTYGMMGEGTDIPWADTVVFAMPRANVMQAAGRIRREYENKKDIALIDFIDTDSPVLASYANSRREWYRAIKATVIEVEG